MSRSTKKQRSEFERAGQSGQDSIGEGSQRAKEAVASARSRIPPSEQGGEEAEVA